MTVVDDVPHLTPGVLGRMAAGVAGGLAGGVVFGVVMQLGGTIPMVAQLVGRESWLVGWTVHMSIAAFVGLTFALIFGYFAAGPPMSTLLGTFYGLIWWVLGGLTLMPLRLGLGLFGFDSSAWESLVGHLGYGVVMGALYAVVAHLLLGAVRRGGAAAESQLPDPPAPPVPAPGPRALAAAPAPAPAGLLGSSPPAGLPLDRSLAAPPAPAQPSILEFVLPPVEADRPSRPAPTGADLAPFPAREPWMPAQRSGPPDALDSGSDRAGDQHAQDLRPPERNPWEVRQHRG